MPMKLALMLCAACTVVACAAPAGSPREEPTMPRARTDAPPPRPPVAAKRRAPPAVAAVMLDGIRYEQAVLARDDAGGGQRTGYLAAYKGSSDERLWRVRVYELRFDPMLEGDVQDVFFTTLAASADGRELRVENEAGGRYAVDVRTHGVRRLD